jgi:hypothetical protein
MSQKVQRYDFNRLKKFEITQNGGIRIDALIGIADTVLDYPWGRELVPAKTLFDPASLQSLEDCVVTIGHKKEHVAFDDVKKHGVGYARSPWKEESELLAKYVIGDLDIVGRVDSGELTETSPGYVARIEHKSGTTADGQQYDAIQHDRIYNHFAIGKTNWSRGGYELRLDSHKNAYFYEEKMSDKKDAQARLDAKFQEEINNLKVHAADLQARLDKREGEFDALKAENAMLVENQRLSEESKSKEIEVAVCNRVALETRAKQLGYKDPIGTTREIHEHCIRLDDKDLDLSDKSDEYVEARFDGLKIPRLDAAGVARKVIMQIAEPNLDDDDETWMKNWEKEEKEQHVVRRSV